MPRSPLRQQHYSFWELSSLGEEKRRRGYRDQRGTRIYLSVSELSRWSSELFMQMPTSSIARILHPNDSAMTPSLPWC